MHIVVKVTDEHIRKGAKLSPCRCPIALAALDQLPEVTDVYVSPIHMRTTNRRQQRRHWKMSEAGKRFMLDFDNGRSVHACELKFDYFSF